MGLKLERLVLESFSSADDAGTLLVISITDIVSACGGEKVLHDALGGFFSYLRMC